MRGTMPSINRDVDYPVKVKFLSGFCEQWFSGGEILLSGGEYLISCDEKIPNNIQLALKLMVGKIYQERGDCGPDCPSGLCVGKQLVRSYKGLRFGQPRRDHCGCLC